jgi:hypothetical protein
MRFERKCIGVLYIILYTGGQLFKSRFVKLNPRLTKLHRNLPNSLYVYNHGDIFPDVLSGLIEVLFSKVLK